MRRCRRAPLEQRYIWAAMEIFSHLPKERQAEIRALVNDIARTPVEARALFDVVVRRMPPLAVAPRTGVTTERLYHMRREFYERIPL